jgi:PAS domain S-box-containing protein
MILSTIRRKTGMIAVTGGMFALGGGAITFSGWAFDVQRLTDWFNDGVSIQPNTCVLFVLSGSALILSALGRFRIVSVLGGLVAGVGAVTLLQYIVDADFGFNHQLTFGRTWGQLTTLTPGRMGPPASTSFTLIGTTLFLVGFRCPIAERYKGFVPIFAVVVGIIAMFSLIGYLFAARQFYTIPSLTAIALPAAMMLMSLAVGLMVRVPDRQPMRLLLSDSGAGTLSRRVLPILILLPPLLGWLRTKGEELGWYDTGTGRSMLILGIVTLSVGLMWWALRLLERHESQQLESANRISGILGSITDAFFTIDKDWQFVFLNEHAVSRVGRSDLIGKNVWREFPEMIGGEAQVQLRRAMEQRISVEYETFHEAWQRWFRDKVYPTADGGLAIYSQEITERKWAEELLRESDARFRHAADAARALVYDVDLNARPATAQTYGMEPIIGEEGRDGAPTSEWWHARIHPDDLRAHLAQLNQCLSHADCAFCQAEYRVRHTDGSWRIVQDHARILRAADRPRRLVGTIIDITDRKRAEAALQQSMSDAQRAEEELRHHAARFETLLNAAPLGVYLVDADFRIRELNPVALPFFGEMEGAIIGRDFAEIIHILWEKEYADEIIGNFRNTLATGQPYVVTERAERRRDRGVTKCYEWRLDRITLPDGRYGVVCYFREISQQVQAREAILRSEQRNRSLISVLTDVPWITDAEGRFVAPQDAWARYTGQTWEQHRDLGWINALHPDDRENVATIWRKACESKSVYRSSGRVWHAATQEYRHFQARATPIVDELSGAVREWVGTCTDVHEQVQAEQALREADRRKDEFLATLAHELRNPLAPVVNGLELLSFLGSTDPIIGESLDTMRRQMKHMVRLIDDLLDISRISRGKMELKKSHIELAACIQHAIEASRPLAQNAEQQLAVQIPSEPIYLDGDSARLSQVFGNLLNNACRYTNRGGRIVLTAWCSESDVIVSVKDDGIGIPPEKLEVIFNMFSQIDSSLERTAGGLGIGLHLVKRLVEMHGGSVRAHSEGLGKGSEFLVCLPVAREEHQLAKTDGNDATSHAPPSSRISTQQRILVVDDNRDAAKTLAMLLKTSGNITLTAHDGVEAVALAESFEPDVILLDIGLPKMNGLDACRAIRQQQRDKKILMIALTGWGQEEDRRKSKEAGFDGHLVKPIDHGELVEILREKQMTPV